MVVIDQNRPPQGGRFEKVGFFNPLTKEKGLRVERIKYWLSVGAQPSDRVYNLLVDEKILEGKKKSVHARKKLKKEEGQEENKTGPVSEEKSEEKSSSEQPAEKETENAKAEPEAKTEDPEKEKGEKQEEQKEEKEEKPQS